MWPIQSSADYIKAIRMEFTMNEKCRKPVNVSYRSDAEHATKRWRGELDMNEWIGIIIRRHVA